jgi:hypothetical protein
MLTDLTKWFMLLAVVVPHQKLAFHDACALKFALQSADGQTCYNGSIDAGSVSSRVLTTLREDLDFGAGSGQTDMDLTILAVVFLFDAYGSPSGQLTAVCDISGFITAGQTHHVTGLWLEMTGCQLPQNTFI